MPGDRRDSKEMNRLLVRVSAEVNQGGRKEMEDFTSIVFEHNPEQSFFAVVTAGGMQRSLQRTGYGQLSKNRKGFTQMMICKL